MADHILITPAAKPNLFFAPQLDGLKGDKGDKGDAGTNGALAPDGDANRPASTEDGRIFLATDDRAASAYDATATKWRDLPGSLADVLNAFTRSRNHVRRYRVNPSALTGAQSGTQTFTTIAAAIVALKADRGTVSTGTGYDPGPQHRALILVDPGTYNEAVSTLPSFVDVIGSSGDPADVVVTSDAAIPTIELGGLTAYVSGITFRQGGSTNSAAGGVYPMHSDSNPTFPGTPTFGPSLKIIHNCVFTSLNPNRKEAVGIGAPSRSAHIFIGCTFNPYAGGIGFNVHNTVASKRPSTVQFVNCTWNTSGGMSAMQVSDLNSGQLDRVSVIGGHMNTPGAANQVVWTTQTGQTLQLELDPAVVTTPVGNNTYPTTVSYVRSSPDGVIASSNRDADDFYHPDARGRVVELSPGPGSTLAAAALTANRVYYLPVDVNAAYLVKAMRVNAVASGGKIATGLYLDDGTGKPGSYLTVSSVKTLTNGVNQAPGAYLRTIWPGIRTLWIGVVADTSAAASALLCSTSLSSARTCYYEDIASGWANLPTTPAPVALTPGATVPFVTATSQ